MLIGVQDEDGNFSLGKQEEEIAKKVILTDMQVALADLVLLRQKIEVSHKELEGLLLEIQKARGELDFVKSLKYPLIESLEQKKEENEKKATESRLVLENLKATIKEAENSLESLIATKQKVELEIKLLEDIKITESRSVNGVRKVLEALKKQKLGLFKQIKSAETKLKEEEIKAQEIIKSCEAEKEGIKQLQKQKDELLAAMEGATQYWEWLQEKEAEVEDRENIVSVMEERLTETYKKQFKQFANL
jgi:chromosome segregation ATPase